ncbi:hypothetical protein HG531_006715 [Fusarium graminearum]|nr:hypothetical protein HG531_006715 [Fusarium graminearum]
MTMTKLNSQLVQVDVALALPRVLRGLISAGYNQGRGNQVAPNEAMVATTGNQESHGQEHGKHLSSGTNKQQLATANTLNEEPRRCRKDGVDNHVNATKQKSKVLIAKDVGAQNREVVDNSVAATDLLHELRASAEKHATEVLCLSTGEQSLDGGALLSSETRSTDGVDNSVALSTGLVTVNLKASDGGDDLFGFFVAVVNDKTENDLEGNGKTPGEVLGTVGAAVVDPVGDEGTKGNDTTFDTNKKTSVGGGGTLSLVGRDSRSVDTVTDTGDCSTNDELSKSRVALHGGDLDDDTENHDPTAQDHSPSTAEQITDPENEHGTEQTSNLVDGSDKALHGAVLCLGEVVMERMQY